MLGTYLRHALSCKDKITIDEYGFVGFSTLCHGENEIPMEAVAEKRSRRGNGCNFN